MDLSDAPAPISGSWRTLLNRMGRSNAVRLDTRDFSWRERRSEVFFSPCCLRIEAVCAADSLRDAGVLALVRGRVLEPFCLPLRDPSDLVYSVLLLLLFIGPATRAPAQRTVSEEQTHISRSAPRLLRKTVLS